MAKAELYIKNGNSWINYNLINAYPVGSVYMSYESASPSTLFGGTWVAITGRFPYFNAGTGTGGNNTHNHGMGSAYGQFYMEKNSTSDVSVLFGWKQGGWSTNDGALLQFGSSHYRRYINEGPIGQKNWGMAIGGSSDNASIMPAYQTLYAWRRTA